MNRNSSSFSTPRGQTLHYRTWEQSSRSYRRILLLVHGFGLHSGSYPAVVSAFTDDSYKVYALDLEGFGKSPGERGDPADLGALVDDVETFRRMIASAEGYREVLLLGHSLGALLALAHAARYPGMGLRMAAASLPLAGPLYGGAGKAVPVPFGLFADGGAQGGGPAEDPLAVKEISARLAGQAKAMAEAVAAAPRALAGRKVLFLHGESDEVAELAPVERFIASLEGHTTEFRTFPRMRHDLFSEKRKENVIAAIREWVGQTEFEHKAP
jgi:alpha-beta hydrolase superfamily lysophospholipase